MVQCFFLVKKQWLEAKKTKEKKPENNKEKHVCVFFGSFTPLLVGFQMFNFSRCMLDVM